ncbi:hypothetical protein LPMP_040360 [Leishmania panamensis]|uniref:Uncharacterized protein n=1 Tax=Leishmania panamensis TaxID=5679 RepID=A0A088RHJ9_LEIPA|nr:hypothetical protein LPMP_040360 [Leishmania panamensis]AIN95363.1 hypothetical protein LPMP_040360 [Leishmania panamensis]
MHMDSRHEAAVTVAMPWLHPLTNAMVSSPTSATMATSVPVFGGNLPAAASSSSGCRQKRMLRSRFSKPCPSPPPSASYTSQQQQQRQRQRQRQRQKDLHYHGGGGGRRDAQLKRFTEPSASEAAMSTSKVAPQRPCREGRSSRNNGGGGGGGGGVAAGVFTEETAAQNAVDPHAQLTKSSTAGCTTTANNDDTEADSSSSSLLPPQQQGQRQQQPNRLNRTRGKRDSNLRAARGWASTQLWEEVEQKQQQERKQRRQLQSRQDRRRMAARGREGSVETGATKHNAANEEGEVVGNVQGAAAASEMVAAIVMCKPRNDCRLSSLPATGTRRVTRQSEKNPTATPSRRPAATEGGARSRHRRRLSPAHPVASSPAVSRESSINDAVGDAAADEELQPSPTTSHAAHGDDATAPEDASRPFLHATNRQSRKQRRTLTTVQQHPSGLGVTTVMAPVTAFGVHPPPPLFIPQDPIIVAQQVSHTTHAVVAESALPALPPRVMRLPEFSSANGSVMDPCVVAAVLPMSAGSAAHAVKPAVLHCGWVNDTTAAFTSGPPAVDLSHPLPPQQQSEEDKQLSRRGLRLGAVPFYPATTARLSLATTLAAGTNPGDTPVALLATAVPSPQSLLESHSMSPPSIQPDSSPLGDSMANRSGSRTWGLMTRQSTFATASGTTAGTPWTLTVPAPSFSSPPPSIGRDDTDGDVPCSSTPSVPLKSPARGLATTASNAEPQSVTVDRPAMRRRALMVTNTATGARVSPVAVTTPSGSPTALWNGGGGSGNGPQARTSKQGSGVSSLSAGAATTSPSGAGYYTGVHSGTTTHCVTVQEFPQAPYPAVNRTTEPHQPQQHPMRSPGLLTESDLDFVQHNRVAVSDVVAKDEGTLVDTLFADVNMIEDDESEVDGDDVLSSYGGERWCMQPVLSSEASCDGSPLAVSSPDALTPHSMNQQLQHFPRSISAGARILGKEAGGQVFGGGYWYPSSPWTSADAAGRGNGSGGAGIASYRVGAGDVKASGAVAWRELSTPPLRHRGFSASCASVSSTMSLIDPKQPQAEAAVYDTMGEDNEWEMNSSAYADSLDEAQIQWIEEQLRATENPAGYF